MLTDAQALLAGTRQKPELTSENRQALMTLQKQEKVLTASMTNIANRLMSIVIEVQNNRLEEEHGRARGGWSITSCSRCRTWFRCRCPT